VECVGAGLRKVGVPGRRDRTRRVSTYCAVVEASRHAVADEQGWQIRGSSCQQRGLRWGQHGSESDARPSLDVMRTSASSIARLFASTITGAAGAPSSWNVGICLPKSPRASPPPTTGAGPAAVAVGCGRWKEKRASWFLRVAAGPSFGGRGVG
jgi:hypothetical protein